MTSPKTIAKIRTYNPSDCTQTGYDVAVRDNGTLRIERHSQWQGSMAGTVWRVRAPSEIMDAARALARDEDVGEDEPDLEALIDDFIGGDWKDRSKRIRVGYRVK